MDEAARIRGTINDAIEAWRDGETCDAVHPLDMPETVLGNWVYDPDAVKDLARVIAKHLEGGGDD